MLSTLPCLLSLLVAPQASDPVQLWTDDALQLVSEIERMHPDPFFGCPREEFEAGVDTFLGSLEGADEPHALVGLMRLVALLAQKGRDGHSGVWPVQARYLPLRFYAFADGWFVVDADAAQREWIGAELVSVGGVPVEEACKRLAPLLTCDNEWNRKVKLAQSLACADILYGAGIVGGADKTRVELARDGKKVELELASAKKSLFDLWGGFNLPARAGTTWLEGRDEAYRMQVLEAEHALYVQYNEVTAVAADKQTIADFAAEIVRTFEERKLAKVIVDVRSNRGGNNTTFGPLIAALQTPSINAPGVLFGLIGRETFSAAGNFTTVLERDTKAILVGEPTGGAPNQYGDAQRVPLANHPNVMVQIATRYHHFSKPDDPRLTHEPTLPVALRAADYFAGKDPVLAAALSYQPPK